MWHVSRYRIQTQLQHSTVSENKLSEVTASKAAVQTCSDQLLVSSADVYSRPLISGRHIVHENGTVDTSQPVSASFGTETPEQR